MEKQSLWATGKQAILRVYLCVLPGICPGFSNDKDENKHHLNVCPAAPPCGPCPRPAAPLLKGRSLFSRTSLASVPSSIRSSLVMTPMVRRPERAQRS